MVPWCLDVCACECWSSLQNCIRSFTLSLGGVAAVGSFLKDGIQFRFELQCLYDWEKCCLTGLAENEDQDFISGRNL